ncbi:ribosome recycling factor [Candidatus Hydrogenedentota bacterium]
MINAEIKQVKEKMGKALEALRREFASIRTGRANTALLDGINVDYYGAHTPIAQMANITVPEPRLLVIVPWDKSAVGAIEKAILKSDLGLTPANDGKTIRLPIPQLTEERRKDLVKHVKKLAEDSRVTIRNIRRDANEHTKKKQKSGELPEDDAHRLVDEIQKVTDKHIENVHELVEIKEAELMEV